MEVSDYKNAELIAYRAYETDKNSIKVKKALFQYLQKTEKYEKTIKLVF